MTLALVEVLASYITIGTGVILLALDTEDRAQALPIAAAMGVSSIIIIACEVFR